MDEKSGWLLHRPQGIWMLETVQGITLLGCESEDERKQCSNEYRVLDTATSLLECMFKTPDI